MATGAAMSYSVISYPTRHTSSRMGTRASWIVVHTTEGNSTLPNAAAYLASNALQVSAHELVGDGVAYVLAADEVATHHAGANTARLPSGETGAAVNRASWGLEIHNQSGQRPSEGAYRVAVERLAAACKRLGLAPERIIAHREVDPSRRSDPTGVSMSELRAAVARTLAPKPVEELPKWSKEAREKGAYYGEALTRLAEGDPAALSELAALLAEPTAEEIAALYHARLLPPLYEARDR